MSRKTGQDDLNQPSHKSSRAHDRILNLRPLRPERGNGRPAANAPYRPVPPGLRVRAIVCLDVMCADRPQLRRSRSPFDISHLTHRGIGALRCFRARATRNTSSTASTVCSTASVVSMWPPRPVTVEVSVALLDLAVQGFPSGAHTDEAYESTARCGASLC